MTEKFRALAVPLCLLAVIGCHGPGPSGRVLTADVPLHLEDHLDAARIEGSEVPKDIPSVCEWRFDEGQPAWKAVASFRPRSKPVQTARVEDALRLTLTKDTRNPSALREGYIYVDLPDWDRDDWDFVVVRAKTSDDIDYIGLEFNLRDKPGSAPVDQCRFVYPGDYVGVIGDGEVHAYLIRADHLAWRKWRGPWKQLGLAVGSREKEDDDSRKGPTSIDILSIDVIPKDIKYAKLKAGTSSQTWDKTTRRALFVHVPSRLEYRVKIPKEGRLDVGLGLLRKNIPVKFRISARTGAAATEILLENTCTGDSPRLQRSVDLSRLVGKTVTLVLETEAERAGNVAFWAAPTLSGERATERPNIILYVIDGAAADFMSVYGYKRRTTPNLERLAAEGVVFENAHSNSSVTKVSVPSFMTSLHSSVLGGERPGSNPLPEGAITMAERMHRAGYMTEVLTSNPYCGRISGLDRGVDVMKDGGEENRRSSSDDLHREFWRLREAYPGEPYWIHFQPTDVHQPWEPAARFEGLFASPDDRRAFDDMLETIKWDITLSYEENIEKSGIDQARFFQIARKLYDESMAYQDFTIGKLVKRLKENGGWDNTLFIVAADHSHMSAGLHLLDPKPPPWEAPLLAAHQSKIPMIFIWPEKIAPGRRFIQPVSMIDMLPTILDLAGLPGPEINQGHSLAPLLLGKGGWKARPIVFDEFNVEGNYLYGSIEVIDGKWGASLRIDPRPDGLKTPRERLRPAPLLIFDVEKDPHALKSLHEERPDLVNKYSKMLGKLWEDHQALAKKFSRAGEVPLTREQIEALRSLGYLR